MNEDVDPDEAETSADGLEMETVKGDPIKISKYSSTR